MDREDGIYLVAVALCSGGAGMFSVGAGLIVAGAMLAIPPLRSMFRGQGEEKR